jgi:hypothetical protein
MEAIRRRRNDARGTGKLQPFASLAGLADLALDMAFTRPAFFLRIIGSVPGFVSPGLC